MLEGEWGVYAALGVTVESCWSIGLMETLEIAAKYLLTHPKNVLIDVS